MFFSTFFVGPLSKGAQEEAQAKDSSVGLGTQQAQKVENPLKSEGALDRHCEFDISLPWFVEKHLLIIHVFHKFKNNQKNLFIPIL